MSRSFWNYAAAAVATYFGQYQLAVSFVVSGAGAEKQRRARNQARDAYNASLQDRMVMLDLQPDAARTLALGRVRAVEGVRRRWTSGTNSDTLVLIVSFAGHEIDGFETFWFNDTELTLDGSGWVQTEPYLKSLVLSDHITLTLDGSGAGAVVLPSTPVSGSLQAVATIGVGDGTEQRQCDITGTHPNYTISGGYADSECTVSWQTASGISKARIRPYLGTDGQNIGADLVGQYPSNISATDRFAGMAAAVVELFYDPDVYSQGVPNVTATFRGAKVLDPRTDTTVWTRNPMLHAYHYARWEWGWDVPLEEVAEQDVIDEADFCNTTTTFTLGVDDVELPRYQCDLVISTDGDPRANMEDILEAMAGRWGWAGGTLRFRAGRMKPSAFTLDTSWLAQKVDSQGNPQPEPVVRITNGVARDSKINRITGKCIDPDQRHQLLPYPTVEDAVLIAAEGEYATNIDLAAVAHIAHAQHLASIVIRQSQAALRMQTLCNLLAYRCELFDVGTAVLPRYGMGAGKTMEVTSWRWHPNEGVRLGLAEITDAMFVPVDELVGRDPAPNGELPLPWQVAVITDVAVTSGTDALTDLSIITRTQVTWTAATNPAVAIGGRIEVQYTPAAGGLPSGDWASVTEQGSATSTTIAGLLGGRFYLFRVRGINSFGVRGPWSAQVLHQVAQPPTLTGGDLVLEVSSAPLFRFADGTTHTTLDPDLTLTARLINLFGEAEWTATAYDAITGGASLGAVTLTGTGNARVLTGAAFTAPGTLGSVRRVDVTASLQGASDTQSVYRYDPTVTEPFLYLSNPTTAVPTDEAGLYGDYSRAVTGGAVLDTGVDDTAAWTLSIEPDAGITSTINDGAGPISGAATVSVAVSDSTLDDGVVLIRATKSGETDLTAPFRITKRKAQGVARLLYFAPREDITLPVDAYGQVTSFSQAWTKAMVRLQDGLDATDQYTYSKTDVGCVSTLTGNRIDITGWVSLGEVDTATSDFYDWAASGWERPHNVFFAGTNWVTVGNHNSTTWQEVQTSALDDFENWAEVDQGVTGKFRLGAYDQGVLCLFQASVASTDLVMRSTDDGATWAAGTALPAPNQWYGAGGGDGYMLVCAQSNTSGARSTDAGASWSSITMPAAGCTPILVGLMMLVRDTMDRLWRSPDAGANWTQITGVPSPFTAAKKFKGRVVATYLHTSTTSVPYSEDDGVTWATATLASAETGPALIEINGVLYLLGAYVHYSLDGKTWTRGDSMGAAQNVVTPPSGGVDITFFPQFNGTSGIWKRWNLLALSATEAAVHVTASKAGEEDLTAVLPVQLGAIVPPNVTSNINPAFLQLPSTADGVVTDYSNAVFAVTAVLSSLTITSEYSWTWTTTNLTPASGSGSSATITAMDVAQDTGSIRFVGTRAGYDTLTLEANVVKSKGADDSGLRIGAAYRIGSVTNTHVAFRLTSAGLVQRKEGVSGSWITLGQWDNPASASSGAGAWTRIDLLSTPDGTSTVTGTTSGSFVALTSDREVSLADSTTGLHVVDIVLYLADNGSGTDPLASLVTLTLDVP